ncbi:MAG: selenide, water dikinase SelD, partial [Dehalococcoidia bacterium]|nr:selenide, water dikinase SelD [Dehalococcoidia bacterium]
VGTSTVDDAAVYRLGDDLAIVQTVDVFTPVVDDPYHYGAISAANALSDVYAMGGRPILALNIVGFPRGKLPLTVLEDILRGGSDKTREAGVLIAGGHSIDDPEPKYGLAVTGLVHPDRVVRNVGARPGDQLVLTKPLGIGIITTGIKQEKTSAAAADEAIRIMERLNRDAADAMVEIGVHAATDVTGFGLLGHLYEMTSGSRVRARLRYPRIPIIDEARSLVRRGAVAGGTARNYEYLTSRVDFDGLEEPDRIILCDAQTSGGLLMAVSPARVDALETALTRRGVIAARIGEISGDGDGRITTEA